MTGGPVRTALVLVDLQRDFLDRPGLQPDAPTLGTAVAHLLHAARAAAVPVAHVHTIVRADGTDRMPHWTRDGVTACVAGTAGVAPPDWATPAPSEPVVAKQYFSGFADGTLDRWLRTVDVTRVVLAGVYTHGCVRSTALDAYERGFEVWVADDAVATPDPVHGAATRAWLDGRAARFVPVRAIVESFTGGTPTPGAPEFEAVAAAAGRVRDAQARWAEAPVAERHALLERWAADLERRSDALASLIVAEVAKPRAAADDEVRRALAHVRATADLLSRAGAGRPVAAGVAVAYRPVGVIGLVMPWNNPVALPVGKLAPALAFGNGVIFKPSPEAERGAVAVLDSLRAAGLPDGLVEIVTGGPRTAEAICDDPRVAAVTVTGSVATGRAIAARGARHAKPVQAELGGNNAVVVLADADLDAIAPALARAAFGYAGQRCTAIRRFVVESAVADPFAEKMRAAIAELVVGDPADPRTEVGPMISVAARDRVRAAIAAAVADGAVVVAGGDVPALGLGGAWLAPTYLREVAPDHPIAQTETFGPVAVQLSVDGIDEAIAVANGVPHGLALAVCTADATAAERVRAGAEAGIVQLGAGPLPVHPDAPFGGWKASGIGPPEHGEWDLAFFARVQAVYGPPPC